MKSSVSDLEAFIAVLRRRRWLVLLCFLAATGAAVGLSVIQQKQYTASASLLFRDPGFDQKLFGSTFLPPSSDPAREAATNLRLVSLQTVAARTARALHGRFDADQIQKKVEVAADGSSNVVSVRATDHSPRLAARLADAFAGQYIAFRREADRSKVSQAQRLVHSQLQRLTPSERAGFEGRQLQGRAEELRIIASLQTGNAELVQRAQIPTSPSSPKVVRNGILGGLVGLLLGVAAALLAHRLDRRLRTVDDLGEAFGLPVLAQIPESNALVGRSDASRSLAGAEADSFLWLRARLRYFNIDREIRSLLITSPAAQDGKTTIAWHFARTAAEMEDGRVLLLETDLRRPSLSAAYGVVSNPGLSDVLAGQASWRDAVQTVSVSDRDDADGLDVITAGMVPPNPGELIESERLAALLRELTDEYDLVVLDAPPAGVVPETLPLMRQVSGVLVVSWLGRTTRDAARHMKTQLKALDASVLGLVANRVPDAGDDYYSYAPSPDAATPVRAADDDAAEVAVAVAAGESSQPAAPGGNSRPAETSTASPPRRRRWRGRS